MLVRWMMGEVMWWESLLMMMLLLLHLERIDIVKRRLLLHMLRNLGVETLHGSGSLASMQRVFRGWHRQRRVESHSVARSVEVTGMLTVVKCVGAAGRRRVVARHLVREHVEAMAVRVHHGGCETRSAKVPWLVGSTRSGVGILDVALLGLNRPEACHVSYCRLLSSLRLFCKPALAMQ